MNGILPLWKERGMTSHDCVFRLRKLLRTKKIGHTGTLDPEVDGVLGICIGKATKVVPYMTDLSKTYEGEITLGIATTTEDAHGEIVEVKSVESIADEIIDETIQSFIGTIEQIPPMFSAVKVNGRRLYDYARNGETVERPVRKAEIYSFERISEVKSDADNHTVSFRFRVHCGKGTYVRTLAVDLGAKLGYPAHMSQLTRTASEPFEAKDCLTLEQVREQLELGTFDQHLKPVDLLFKNYPRQEATPELYAQVKNGAVLPSEIISPMNDDVVAIYHEEQLVALYEKHPRKDGLYKPKTMFIP